MGTEVENRLGFRFSTSQRREGGLFRSTLYREAPPRAFAFFSREVGSTPLLCCRIRKRRQRVREVLCPRSKSKAFSVLKALCPDRKGDEPLVVGARLVISTSRTGARTAGGNSRRHWRKRKVRRLGRRARGPVPPPRRVDELRARPRAERQRARGLCVCEMERDRTLLSAPSRVSFIVVLTFDAFRLC